MEPAREEGEERGSSRKWIWALLIALGIAGPILTLGLLATFVLPNIVKQLYVANTTKAMADIARNDPDREFEDNTTPDMPWGTIEDE